MTSAERQLELLHGFLAEHPRPAGTSVSAHVQREADAGNVAAQRVLKSGLFSVGSDAEDAQAATPIVPPAVLERERRLATQRVPTGMNSREPKRPIVNSGVTPDWLK